jgi:hypothetical protein
MTRTRPYGVGHAAAVGELDGAVEAAQQQMGDRSVEDRQVGGGLEAPTLGFVQSLAQVGTAQRRCDGHLLDDGRLGAPPVTTELSAGVGVSAHRNGTDQTDRDEAGKDVQHEQLWTVSATSETEHALPSA